MATDVKPSSTNSTGTVVSDIIHDAQELVSQQLKMFQAEIRQDIGKMQQASIPLACGLAVMLVGAALVGVALAYLLNWLWPGLPLWGAFALMGAIWAALGAGLYVTGKKQLEAINPLPEKSAEALKENLTWLTPK